MPPPPRFGGLVRFDFVNDLFDGDSQLGHALQRIFNLLELIGVVDDLQQQTTAGASCNVLTVRQVFLQTIKLSRLHHRIVQCKEWHINYLCDFKAVTAGARIVVGLRFLVPVKVFDFNFVVIRSHPHKECTKLS